MVLTSKNYLGSIFFFQYGGHKEPVLTPYISERISPFRLRFGDEEIRVIVDL